MKLLGVALAALLVAVLAGYGIGHMPGNVTMMAGGKIARVSLPFFAVASIVGSFLLWTSVRMLYRLLTLRRRLTRWRTERSRRRAERTLHQGLLALAAGNYRKAEKLLDRSGRTGVAPAIPYLAAAEAAQHQSAADRRDRYLELAALETPDAEIAAELRRAEFELASRQFDQARKLLEALSDRYPGNPQVLNLLHRLHVRTANWPSLLKLVPELKRFKILPGDELRLLEQRSAEALLAAPLGTREALDSLWDNLSKNVRNQHGVRVAYCAQLYAQDRAGEAEPLLLKLLDESWEARLVRLYGERGGSDPVKRLEVAERWLKGREDDPELLLTLGRLAVAGHVWDKARDFLKACIVAGSVAGSAEPIAFELLAQAYEGLGESLKAAQCRRRGLTLALRNNTVNAALPAPADL